MKQQSSDIEIIKADYDTPEHARAVVELTDVYAREEMGQGAPLSDVARAKLVPELKRLGTAFSLLARQGEEYVGLINAVLSYSSFKAQRLVNIHDIMVRPELRDEGIGSSLLEAIEEEARKMDCCKITLEVRQDNPAKRLYERFGFGYDEAPMAFLKKEL